MKYQIGQKVYVLYEYAPNGLIEADIIGIEPKDNIADTIYRFKMFNYSVSGTMTNSWAGGTFISFRQTEGTCSEDLIVPFGIASRVLYGTNRSNFW